MACSRRALTSTFSHLSRRFHPSLSHITHHRRRDPSPSPSPAATAATGTAIPIFSSPFYPGTGFAPHRFYSSESGNTETLTEFADVIADPTAEVLTDASIETVSAAAAAAVPSEVAVAAADSFAPVAALQYLIDGVHSVTGLHWWAAIALTTVLIRTATIPLLLNQLKSTMKLNMMRPELEELKKEMENSTDPESRKKGQMRMAALFKKHDLTPFTPLKGLFIQGPIFISFFFAIQNMVEKVPSFKEGGALWFTDLTTPDPMYMLPVLTSLTFLATVELNMQEGMEGNPMVNTMKNFSRVLALMTIPFTAHFPKAIFCYWITTNLFSLGYGFVLKRPPVRAYLNLPVITVEPQPKNPAPPADFSLFGVPKPTPSTSPTSPADEHEQVQTPRGRVSSSSVISERIRSLEKSIKARSISDRERSA